MLNFTDRTGSRGWRASNETRSAPKIVTRYTNYGWDPSYGQALTSAGVGVDAGEAVVHLSVADVPLAGPGRGLGQGEAGRGPVQVGAEGRVVEGRALTSAGVGVDAGEAVVHLYPCEISSTAQAYSQKYPRIGEKADA